MINFKHLIESSNQEKLEFIITVEGHPVWDYKAGPSGTIYLISEDPWEGVEEDYVSLGELRKYIAQMKIPFDSVTFKTEADNQILTRIQWDTSAIHLYF